MYTQVVRNAGLAFAAVASSVVLSGLISDVRPAVPRAVKEVEPPVVAVGTQINVRGADEGGTPLPKKGTRILVSMSDCDSCSMTALDLKRLAKVGHHLPLILVFPDKRTLNASPKVGIRAIDTVPSWLPKTMTLFRPQAVLLNSEGFVVSTAFGGPEILDMVRGGTL